MKGKEIRPAFH
jgi:hypothetical protein